MCLWKRATDKTVITYLRLLSIPLNRSLIHRDFTLLFSPSYGNVFVAYETKLYSVNL